MGFPENVLTKNEKVVQQMRPHWLTVALPTLIGVGLAVAAILAVTLTGDGFFGQSLQWVVIIAAAVLAFIAVVLPYSRWINTKYVITTHRVMIRTGLISKSGKDITLSKITDVSFHQGIVDRVVGAGSLYIETAGDSPNENMRSVPHSDEVQQLINKLIDEDDLRRREHGRGPTG